MTDAPETVGDLGPDRTVYLSTGSHPRKVHLDDKCEHVIEPREKTAGVLLGHHELCLACTGESQAREHGGDGKRTRKKLLAFDPEVVTDGGER